MATSSIFHTPKFDTPEKVENLINAIEESEKTKIAEEERKYEFQTNVYYYSDNSIECCDETKLKYNLTQLFHDNYLVYSILELCRKLNVDETKDFGVCNITRVK